MIFQHNTYFAFMFFRSKNTGSPVYFGLRTDDDDDGEGIKRWAAGCYEKDGTVTNIFSDLEWNILQDRRKFWDCVLSEKM